MRLLLDLHQLPQGMIVHQPTLRVRRIVRRRLPASPRGRQAPTLAVGHLDPQRQTAIGAPVTRQDQRLLTVQRVPGALELNAPRLKIANLISLIYFRWRVIGDWGVKTKLSSA